MSSQPSPDDGGPRDAIAQLSKIVLGDASLTITLQRIAELTKQVVPELEEVSVTVMENDKARTVVFTGPLAVDLDERQYEAGYGPCMDAAVSGDTIRVANTEPDSPYPHFSAAAAAHGITHTTSIGLPVAQRTVGAINLYSATNQPLDDATVALVETFAGYAAVAITNATRYSSSLDQAEQMSQALKSRAAIEQAKGIIMAQRRCTADQAFALLTRASQRQNQKLRDVAETIVAQTQP